MLNLDKFKKKEEEKLKEGKTSLREKESQEKLTNVDYKSPGAFHIEPEYRELIRKQTEDEARNFEESIKAEGVREPILYWTHTLRDNTGARVVHTVVDGHHRCEAAIKLGLEYIPCKELKFSTHNDVRIWMLRNQLGRRNIGDAEKIRIALQLTEFLGIEAKERKKRQVQGFNAAADKKVEAKPVEVSEEQNELDDLKKSLNIDPKGRINRAEEAAKIAGVSTKNVTKMKKVIEKGPADMLNAVMDGYLSIHKAWTELRAVELEEKKKRSRKPKKVDKDLTPKQVQALLNNAVLVEKVSRVALAFRYPDTSFEEQNVNPSHQHYNDFTIRFVENNAEVKQSKFADVVQVVKPNDSELSPLVVGYQIVSTFDDLQNLNSLIDLSASCHKFYIVVDDSLLEEAKRQVEKQKLKVGIITTNPSPQVEVALESHYIVLNEHQELQILREAFFRSL
ncbi:ParB N-terminal domain-containing protein [Flammeovirga aprica]|uniref:ParB N-terminal domain-containing protein n=1 Tax=Flammeovirga aprica JL-4 TaxID=694437 RepID=A0A7X9XC75_9BACT|nr:ParB N-terminal domain-containing protein [Flammeovirga aprica]NME71517.1 ParB N-terminal domain-containing protein [Flammeovirga aprica JL-4]